MKSRATVWRMKGPILPLTWIDNKPVTISGTITGIPEEQLPEVQRRKKDGTLENVACPPIVSASNCYMGGVDKNDQMKSYYAINISGKKLWTRISLTWLTGPYSMAKYCSMNPRTLQEKA